MGTFYSANGWYFERVLEPMPDKYAWVHIYHRKDNMADGEIDAEVLIPPNTWASIVASVSLEGENALTFGIAKELHGVLSYMS